MDMQKIWGFVRRGITAVGVFLVALGYADADSVGDLATSFDAIIGAGMTILGFVLSLVAKIRGNTDNPTPVQAAAKAPDAVDKAVDKAIDKATK